MRRSISRRDSQGFTLIEMLVALGVLILLMLILTQLTDGLRQAISRTTTQVESFQQARNALETIPRRLNQATLNAYDDLNPIVSATAGITSTGYSRESELRFISGNVDSQTGMPATTPPLFGGSDNSHPTQGIFFEAPLGFATAGTGYTSLNKLLNTCGYFIEWGSDGARVTNPNTYLGSGANNPSLYAQPPFLSAVLPARWRYRLMEMIEPTDLNSVYAYTSGTSASSGSASQSWYYNSLSTTPAGLLWYQNALGESPRPVHPIAENVIFLAVLPIVAPQNAHTTQPAYPGNPSPSAGAAPDGTSTDIAPTYYYDSSISSGLTPDSLNQLPTSVYLLMIAVDEKSFSRYETGYMAAHSTLAPSSDLGLTNILTNAFYANRLADVSQVTNALIARNIQYRIFSVSVPLTPN